MDKDSKIYIAGHTGLVGSNIVKSLERQGYTNIITRPHYLLDLTDQYQTAEFFAAAKPEYVFLAAAKVGGILANDTYRAEFIYNNLMIQSNIIHYSYLHGVKKLIFLGSTCAYPRNAPQPIREDYLLSGPLEPTNEPYAVAKIAGIKMCEAYNDQYSTNFVTVMPPNIYGPEDNFNEDSHALSSIMRKLCNANSETVSLYGTGRPMREFMFSEDVGDACVFIMENDSPPVINIGTSEEISIKDLADKIKNVVGYHGKIIWDHSKPDGVERKKADLTKFKEMGFKHKTNLDIGLRLTHKAFIENAKYDR